MIVHVDISELFFKDMRGFSLGAWVATDFNFTILNATPPDPAASLKDWLVTQKFFIDNPDPTFFNAGTLLMDLDKWRTDQLTTRVENWMNVTQAAGIYADDQTWLNLQFHWAGSGFLPLEKKWNHNPAQICKFAGDDIKRAPKAIYHWKGPMKFWKEPFMEFCFYKAYKLKGECT